MERNEDGEAKLCPMGMCLVDECTCMLYADESDDSLWCPCCDGLLIDDFSPCLRCGWR